MQRLFRKKVITLSYAAGFLASIACFSFKQDMSLGVLVGVTVGAVNFFFLEKQIELFTKNRKMYFVFLHYIIRYILLGLILYTLIKLSTMLFLGTVLGFFINQAVFFAVKLRST